MGFGFHDCTLLGCTEEIKVDCGKNPYRNKMVRECSGRTEGFGNWSVVPEGSGAQSFRCAKIVKMEVGCDGGFRAPARGAPEKNIQEMNARK